MQEAVGLSPIRFIQRVRAEEAVHRLETTRESVDEIARRVGYEGGSTLRRVLRREMHLGARDVRS